MLFQIPLMSCDQPKINEITKEDAAAIISQTAKEHGGSIPKHSLAARVQSLADRNAMAETGPRSESRLDQMTMKDGIDLVQESSDEKS
jgi:hypothetical protein